MTTNKDPPISGARDGITYTRLRSDQIRLLHLFPSLKEEAQVQCSLESFDRPPPYIALSYTWGDQNDTRKILVNGQIFEATKNLEEALNHLRHRKEKLYFWVDAICMNQTDEDEKQHQLQLMPTIFSRAQETRVWLGPEENGSNQAIDLIHTLSGLPVESSGKDEPEWASSGASRPWTDGDLVALQHLFVRQYWYRVWVVQEIAMSKKVEIFCGLNQLSWDSVLNATELMIPNTVTGSVIYNYVARHPSLRGIHDGMQRILSIQSVRNDKLQPASAKERPPDSLLFLLSSHRSTKASEARDKYYALAGLVSEDDSILSQRSSAKSMEDIYILAAESTTKERGHSALDFLDFAGWPTNISSLPSWVPDWSYTRDRAIPLLYWQLAGMKHKDMVYLSAPGSHNPSLSKTFVFRSKEKCLWAQGFEFDAISGVGYSRWPYTESPEVQNSETPAAYGNKSYPIGGEALADVLWRTLVLNLSHAEGLKAPAGWGDLFYHKLFRSGGDALWYRQNKNFRVHGVTLERIARDQRELKPDFQLGPPSTDETSYLISAFDIANRYRRLATTKKGYLCLAPSTSLPGDLVVILFDCQVPVVLRRKDNHFTFIGTCYVHGIMQGEAMGGLSSQQPVWFEIQ